MVGPTGNSSFRIHFRNVFFLTIICICMNVVEQGYVDKNGPLRCFGVVNALSLLLCSGSDFAGGTECFGHPVRDHSDDGFLT